MTKKKLVTGFIIAIVVLLIIFTFYFYIGRETIGKAVPTVLEEECWEALVINEQGDNLECVSVADCVSVFEDEGLGDYSDRLRCVDGVCEYSTDCEVGGVGGGLG